MSYLVSDSLPKAPTPSPKPKAPEEDENSGSGYAKAQQDTMEELSAMNADINDMATGIFMKPVNMAVGAVKGGFSMATSGLSSMLSDTNTGSPDEHQDKLSGLGDKSNMINQVVGAVEKVGEFVAENPEILLA